MSQEDVYADVDMKKVFDLILYEPRLEDAVKKLVEMCENDMSPEGHFIIDICEQQIGSTDVRLVVLARLGLMAIYLAKQKAAVSLN